MSLPEKRNLPQRKSFGVRLRTGSDIELNGEKSEKARARAQEKAEGTEDRGDVMLMILASLLRASSSDFLGGPPCLRVSVVGFVYSRQRGTTSRCRGLVSGCPLPLAAVAAALSTGAAASSEGLYLAALMYPCT